MTVQLGHGAGAGARGTQMNPATQQDIADLKLYVTEREISWLKWVVGFQLAYFVIVIAAMFFIAENVR